MAKNRWIRLFTIIMSAVLLLQCGCAMSENISNGSSFSEVMSACSTDIFGEGEQAYTEPVISLPRHSGYAPLTDKTAYESLSTDSQRKAYLSIERSLYRITGTDGHENGRYEMCRAEIPKLTSGEIFMVKEAVLADHPEAFWANGKYSLGFNLSDGDYVILYSTYSSVEIESMSEAISKRVAELLREIPSDLNEYDREVIIHDLIVRDVEYDTDAAQDSSPDSKAANIYGALVNGKAICSGYSKTAKLLLNRVGISCMTVKGVSKDVGHMWNLVRVDGDWYHLDVTWDDPVTYSAESIYSYDYFNLTDEAISVDHDIAGDYSQLTDEIIKNQSESSLNFFNFTKPECVSEKANFYAKNAFLVNELNSSYSNVISQLISDLQASGMDTLFLSFPVNMEPVVIEEWLNNALKAGWSSANQNAGGGKKISRCIMTKSAGSDVAVKRGRYVYIVKFYY